MAAFISVERLQQFWNGIKAMIPTKTSDLTNDSNYISDVVSALKEETGYQNIEVNLNKSIRIDRGTNILPSSIASENGFCCVCIPCVTGDIFMITGKGGSQTQLWGFSDSNGDIIDNSGSGKSATNLVLTAPNGSAYFAYNSRTSVIYKVYKAIDLEPGNVLSLDSNYNVEWSKITPSSIGAITAPTGATSGQFLMYDGTDWVAQTLEEWSGGTY